MTGYRFEFRPLTALAALAALAATLALCNWQLDRAHEKEAVGARLARLAKEPPIAIGQALLDAADLEWRRVSARGRFEPDHAVFVDNRIYRGVAGYHVYMPLALTGGERRVLVNRGWIAAPAVRGRVPEVPTPAGTVEVGGLAVVPSERFLELSDEVQQGRVWQNLTLERYRRVAPWPLQPVVIRQDTPLEDGLVRDWPPPDLGVEKHYGYAFQWAALAATIVIFYVVTHVRRRTPPQPR